MSNPALTSNAAAFLARKPTLIGSVFGDRFYEHPHYGDEHPLVVVTADGRLKVSDFYELPSAEEYEGF